MGSDDLIDFEIIENQKENIQSLPSGRSARALAQLYTPPLSGAGKAPSPLQLQDAHSAARQEFEKELAAIDEADDPLEVYDRYVKWTLDTYPSAQNTRESQLCTLLERATQAFQGADLYRNDPRYLKLWLHYIRLFSDTPRETFAFLSRHHIGDGLALFYEEFAAWLETAGRWTQAEEVYGLGIDREARPVERLIRKYGEFQHRRESRPQDAPEPTSPALPAVRPALAAKVDPFALAPAEPADPQAQTGGTRLGEAAPKSGKQKMAIFSDADEKPPASGGSTTGWDSIGSLADRKKENTTEARPWAGETLKVGKKPVAQKMMIFKDETESISRNDESISHHMREFQQAVNPRTGRVEVVFTDLRYVYPDPDNPAVEFSFEELRAQHRGWSDYDWSATRLEAPKKKSKQVESRAVAEPAPAPAPVHESLDEPPERPRKPQTVPLKGSMEDDLVGNDENMPPSQAELDKAKAARKARREERANRTRKIKVMEVREIRAEAQTVETKLDSPTGPKKKLKKNGSSAEPTMTLHTKEAMDDIYDIFNQPLKTPGETDEPEAEAESDSSREDSSDEDEDDYTSGGESTGTGRMSGANSEFGDDTAGDFTLRTTVDDDEEQDDLSDGDDGDDTDVKSVSEWSEFTESKHVPKDHQSDESGDESDHSEGEGDSFEELSELNVEEHLKRQHDDLVPPTSPELPTRSLPTRFVPTQPEDYDVPTQPYRNSNQAANNRLPFMTPIVEKTESSVGMATTQSQKDYYSAKTPSRSRGTPAIMEDDGEPWSSPFRDVLDQGTNYSGKVTQLALRDARKPAEAVVDPKPQTLPKKDVKQTGPIIIDSQCNPVAEDIRNTVLSQIQPPLASYDGYWEDRSIACGKGAEICKFIKALQKSRTSIDKTNTKVSTPPVLQLEGTERTYTVKRELGKGAFAPVYLVESTAPDQDEDKPVQMGKGDFGIKRHALEAIKMEDPPSAWEFYIMRQVKRRLGVSRAGDAVINVYEMHMFKNECYLVEEFRGQGTLLDLVNLSRAENGVMDEHLVMFFTVELFRTVEAIHAKGLIHGDLKSDNVLVRFDAPQGYEQWDSQYTRDGTNGWASKGITLIDFGRGIDMKVFKPDVQFIADWETSEQDCAEMRDMRPWTYQVDYHGLAGIVHNLLFGKYIKTVAEGGATLGAGATKTYRIRESLKRYWQTDIWNEVFDLLLNPLMHLEGEEGRKLPVTKGMKGAREKMEGFLEDNCKKGAGLKDLVRRMEDAVSKRK